MSFCKKILIPWFLEEKRIFPWRENPTPYRVWISEVMLQQTRAIVVIPYFEKWMARFPTIEALAKASSEEVIKMWEGLGYYGRARLLHAAAKEIVSEYGGALPADEAHLKKIKGVGPYTLGAILSFAFHKRAAAIDGNVARVISRLFCLEGALEKRETQEQIRAKVEQLLAEEEEKPWILMEALIEFGAVVCTKVPLCSTCPLQDSCIAHERGKERELPRKKKRKETIRLKRSVFLICYQELVLLRRPEIKGVMRDLYEFPYVERKEGIENIYPETLHIEDLSEEMHHFTSYAVTLFPSVWKAMVQKEIVGFIWVRKEELTKLPFSSGHRRILQRWMERDAYFAHGKF